MVSATARLNENRYVFFLPFVVLIVGYLLGLFLIGPEVQSGFSTKFSSFFLTAAQVMAAAFVALAFQARLYATGTALLSRRATRLAFVYVVVGVVAAVAALSPSLPGWLYEQAFALTVGCGLAVLIALLLVAGRQITAATRDEEKEQLKTLAGLGDPVAKQMLEQDGD